MEYQQNLQKKISWEYPAKIISENDKLNKMRSEGTDRIAGIFLLYMTKFVKNLVRGQLPNLFTDSESNQSEGLTFLRRNRQDAVLRGEMKFISFQTAGLKYSSASVPPPRRRKQGKCQCRWHPRQDAGEQFFGNCHCNPVFPCLFPRHRA